MKRGRPKLKASERRSIHILIRVTNEESKIIEAYAKALGSSLSDYCRETLLLGKRLVSSVRRH